MIRFCKFSNFGKSRFPKQYRLDNKISRYIVLLHSPLFYIFGKNHCWVNIKKKYKYIKGRHIVKGTIKKYNKGYTITNLSIII